MPSVTRRTGRKGATAIFITAGQGTQHGARQGVRVTHVIAR
ncbi:hypothetical protein [Erythrobacter donghaensis]|nr:hypothetical protein [Erythrobacter donghaensis]